MRVKWAWCEPGSGPPAAPRWRERTRVRCRVGAYWGRTERGGAREGPQPGQRDGRPSAATRTARGTLGHARQLVPYARPVALMSVPPHALPASAWAVPPLADLTPDEAAPTGAQPVPPCLLRPLGARAGYSRCAGSAAVVARPGAAPLARADHDPDRPGGGARRRPRRAGRLPPGDPHRRRRDRQDASRPAGGA